MSQPEWWETFFVGPYTNFQPNAFDEDATSKQLDRIEELVGTEPRDVLDVPCGDGRIGLGLTARRGHRLTGIDLNPAMLELGRARAKADGVAASFIEQDMKTLDEEAAFDLAINWWGSFGYFDDAGDRVFAERVHRALRKDGQLVLDAVVLEGVLPRFARSSVIRREQSMIIEERAYDVKAGRIASTYTFVTDGKTETRTASIRLYTVRELVLLLGAAGFRDVEVHDYVAGEFKVGPPGTGSFRAILIATK